MPDTGGSAGHGSVIADAVAWWRRPARWLARVPVTDPVDRRNAPMLQVVLLLLGITPPLMWLSRATVSQIPWRPGELGSMAISLGISAIALFGFVLIRKGHFQWAARQLLVVIAAGMMVSYATGGYLAGRYEQPLLVVWIALAGLVVGRRALWAMYACMIIAFAAGYLVDAREATDPIDTPRNMAMAYLMVCVMYLLIAVVVDRSVLALRGALAEANRRGDELASSNRRLESEIAERTKVQEQLIHAQKVEAIGRLASGVAHDFNHLLSLILGYVRRAAIDDPAARKKALDGIESAARRATSVTHKLLHFGRRDVTRIETFDAGQVVRELQPMLRQLFDPSVRIVYDVSDVAQPVAFDRAQFELVVLNIAANANQAMPDGGEFHVGLNRAPDASVELRLRDTGQGMSEAVRERVFEPFFTTKPSGQGIGLGLAVAANVIAAAGGDIAVDSMPGGGATFRIRLPAAAESELATDTQAAAPPACPEAAG